MWGKSSKREDCGANWHKKIHGDDAPFDPSPLFAIIDDSDKEKAILLWGADHYKTRLPEGGRFLTWDKAAPLTLSMPNTPG